MHIVSGYRNSRHFVKFNRRMCVSLPVSLFSRLSWEEKESLVTTMPACAKISTYYPWTRWSQDRILGHSSSKAYQALKKDLVIGWWWCLGDMNPDVDFWPVERPSHCETSLPCFVGKAGWIQGWGIQGICPSKPSSYFSWNISWYSKYFIDFWWKSHHFLLWCGC